MIISHRGRYNGFLENTIPAFEAALKAGADAVECDLRLTLDKKVIVNHDKHIKLNGSRIKISKTPLKDLIKPRHEEKPLTIDDLFEYIRQKQVPFFLEVKNRSPMLVEAIAQKIKDKKLWDRVHIMGFSIFIKNALRAQERYEKLRVLPIITNPFYSYIRKPKKSYGVFVGWIDEWYGSGLLFRKLISTNRLIKLKSFYEKKGFKVMAGVINKDEGFKYFKQAGIVDIVTDNVKEAVDYFKSRDPETSSE